ncbi:MAG: response regulator transcription factor [Chloroflexi bacterium]|nr:response regulator transcription factor [Chloroflexota bacterium]
MIRVMIVDDQVIVREGLKKILTLEPEIEITCEATNGYEAIEQLGRHKVEVILLDVRMPKMDGIQAAGKIKQLYPEIKIIILTTFNEDEYLFEGIKSGISGFLLKDSEIDYVIKSVKEASQNKMVFDPGVTPKLIQAITDSSREPVTTWAELEGLTGRETAIVKLVAKGWTNQQIANELFISEGTVKNHISDILRKLNLERRTQISAYFYRSTRR